MRTLTNVILTAILLVASGQPIAPLLASHNVDRVAFASDQNPADDNDRGDGEASHNRGRGDNLEIGVTEGYTVEAICEFDDDDNITECEFSGVAPEGASDVGRITVPADAICAEVLGGDFVYVDPDAGASVTGYASEEDDDKFELELHGEVTTAGTMTYWISTIGNVFPAEGPALRCHQAPDLTTMPTATPPTETPEITTGTLVVATYACDNVPADTSAFDWFGQCEPGSDPLTFVVTPADANAVDQRIMETDTTGEATFDTLEPGTYRLDALDASWCHAKSDRVTSESEVVLQAGEQTTVWTFYCGVGEE